MWDEKELMELKAYLGTTEKYFSIIATVYFSFYLIDEYIKIYTP